jgi:xylulokinase
VAEPALPGPLLCGVDAGTSRVRAVLFDLRGVAVAEASRPTPTELLGPGEAQHDAEALWTTAAAVLREATGQIDDPRRVRGVAVASMGEAGTLLDRSGRALVPLLAWYDTRTAPLLDRLLGEVGFETLHRLTGLCPDPTFSLLKLLWLKEHRPEAFARASAWLQVSDLIAWRLSGQIATDTSLASRTMALDLAHGRWADELLRAVDVPARLFPRLAGSGERLGCVTAEAAAATGLPEGCAVGVAGHDHVCGMLAAGADRPGILLDSMGTAEALTYVIEAPSGDPELGQAGFNQGLIRLDRPLWYVFGGLPTSAACVEWFRAAQGQPPPDHATLIAEAAAAPPGSGGVLFLPHLRIGSPPFPDPIARGAFLGLTDGTDRGALFRAVLEGLALDAANLLRVLGERFAMPRPQRLIAIGGSTRNRLLMAIKASLYGQAIDVAETTECTSLGAAMLGGVAAGLFASHGEARAAMAPAFATIGPAGGFPAAEREPAQRRYAAAYAAARQLLSELRAEAPRAAADELTQRPRGRA